MIYKIIQPSPQLQDFVKDYLLLHYIFDKNVITPIKPFPANTQYCLVFYLQGGVTAFDPQNRTFKKLSQDGYKWFTNFTFQFSSFTKLINVLR